MIALPSGPSGRKRMVSWLRMLGKGMRRESKLAAEGVESECDVMIREVAGWK